MPNRRILGLLGFLLAGCPDGGEVVACTDLAAASVQLTVVDEAGSAVPGVSASWRQGRSEGVV